MVDLYLTGQNVPLITMVTILGYNQHIHGQKQLCWTQPASLADKLQAEELKFTQHCEGLAP